MRERRRSAETTVTKNRMFVRNLRTGAASAVSMERRRSAPAAPPRQSRARQREPFSRPFSHTLLLLPYAAQSIRPSGFIIQIRPWYTALNNTLTTLPAQA